MERHRVRTVRETEPSPVSEPDAREVAPPVVDPNTHKSRAREKLLEHVFIAEVLQEAWFAHQATVEVLRAEVDDAGYDLVLACRGSIRWIQLKASQKGGATSEQSIALALADKPGACVVWVIFEEDPHTHRAKLSYRWFGGGINEHIGDLGVRVASNPVTKKARPRYRRLTIGQFRRIDSTSELVHVLFGDLAADAVGSPQS